MKAHWLAFLVGFIFLSDSAFADASGQWHDISVPKKYGDPEVIRGLLDLPDGGDMSPAVVLMHGCGGLSDIVMAGLEAHATALRDAGFATLILDSFGPRNLDGGVVCESFEALRKAVYNRRFDAFGAHEFLENITAIDGRNIFLMGQSNGGSVAVSMAQPHIKKATGQDRSFRAVTALYPWCRTFKGRELMSPLLILTGSDDDWTPPKACVDRLGTMEGAIYDVQVFDGAYHSFDLPMPVHTYKGHNVGGNSVATKQARARMVEFFLSHLEP